uniref:RRM domain-containing protein n=1 Tax=Auxenochlorella protothecoides TaxID=3075 RepID=A0A1D2AC47_AUXPR
MGSNPPMAHPNVFVRGLPLAWGEVEITALFQQYGTLTSIRLVRHSVTKHSLGYGFVRFQSFEDAQAAINALDATTTHGQTLQVKFADADAGPPAASPVSGLTPSESVYVKHLPAASTVSDVQALFEGIGGVQDVKLFPCLDHFRSASALVRMASRRDSERAIAALNNTTPAGSLQSLVVRYAESAAEKAARLARRNPARAGTGLGPGAAATAGVLGAGLGGAAHADLQSALSALTGLQPGLLDARQLLRAALAGGAGGGVPGLSGPGPGDRPVTLTLTGLPPATDRLWLYESFAAYGAILSLHVLQDEATGQCSGTGLITFGNAGSAERAAVSMHGAHVGDHVLSVTLQPASGTQAPGGSLHPGLAAALGGNWVGPEW